jgi:hypothetical protein
MPTGQTTQLGFRPGEGFVKGHDFSHVDEIKANQ